MAALGDRMLTSTGRRSSLKRPSVPLQQFPAFPGEQAVSLIDGAPVSFSRIYEQQPWVYRAVTALGQQIARLPLKTYALDADGNREQVRDHPLAHVLAAAHAGRSPLDLKWKIASGLLTHGNRVVEKVRPATAAPPVALDALDWRYLLPIMEDGQVLGWRHRPPTGPARTLDPADVIHFRWAAPDGQLGVSPLAPLGITVRSEDGGQRYADALLRNGARVGLVIRTGDRVQADKAARDAVRDEIAGGFTLDNLGKSLILSDAVEEVTQAPQQTAVEAELIDQRKLNREEIAAVYGIPQPIIGILDHGTLSNFETAHRMLYTTVLGPWLELVQAQVEAQLIAAEPAWADSGLFVEFTLDEVLKGDTRERMAAYRDALAAGALTINDIRRLENLPPFPDSAADEPLVAANNLAPLSMLPALAAGRGAQPSATAPSAGIEEALQRALQDAGVNGHSQDLARAVVEALQ